MDKDSSSNLHSSPRRSPARALQVGGVRSESKHVLELGSFPQQPISGPTPPRGSGGVAKAPAIVIIDLSLSQETPLDGNTDDRASLQEASTITDNQAEIAQSGQHGGQPIHKLELDGGSQDEDDVPIGALNTAGREELSVDRKRKKEGSDTQQKATKSLESSQRYESVLKRQRSDSGGIESQTDKANVVRGRCHAYVSKTGSQNCDCLQYVGSSNGSRCTECQHAPTHHEKIDDSRVLPRQSVDNQLEPPCRFRLPGGRLPGDTICVCPGHVLGYRSMLGIRCEYCDHGPQYHATHFQDSAIRASSS